MKLEFVIVLNKEGRHLQDVLKEMPIHVWRWAKKTTGAIQKSTVKEIK